MEADGDGPGDENVCIRIYSTKNRGSTGKYCVKGVSKVCFKNCNLVAQSGRKLKRGFTCRVYGCMGLVINPGVKVACNIMQNKLNNFGRTKGCGYCLGPKRLAGK